ncbi:type IV pilus assembly protein PilM [bacterium]|nr:type IV pilus assembly protein PilM [bacterium]
MKFPLIEKRQPVFGLDIGYKEAKFVQVKSTKSGHRLLGMGAAALSDGMVIDGVIAEPEDLAHVINASLHRAARGKITARSVVIGLPQSHLFSRIITTPALAEDKLADAVLWEAQQYIPMPVNDLYTDHQIVERQKDESGIVHEYAVLLVAAPRSIVDSYLKLCDLAHLVPRSMEMSLMANIRALRPTVEEQTATLIIDAGALATDMAIVTDTIRVTTTVNIGGESFTNAIATKLRVTFHEAEEMKIKFGITQSDLQPKIRVALSTHLKKILQEITKLIKYYEERTKGTTRSTVKRIMMTGGNSRMPGLAHLISHTTNLPVDISAGWDRHPTSGVDGVPKNLGPIYNTAFGLACRGWE